MAKEKENRWIGLLIGPAITFFALTALWKNETRFDFHRAAKKTIPVSSTSEAVAGDLISFTGPMDQNLKIQGDYVEIFNGYLFVKRRAEIYAWDKRKDKDDHVRWELRWSSHLESNSRNNGIRKLLSSREFLPGEYQVGELKVNTEKIEFVDSKHSIPNSEFAIKRANLKPEGEYLYLRKNLSTGLGDERVSYVGIPVPATASYFGKFENGKGVADTTHQRDHWINSIIGDSGILHHLVAGDRTVALASMKQYIGRLKWIVRGIGTAAVVFGLVFLFSTILGALYHIPVLGRIAETGAFLLALAIGLPLATIVIVSSYLIAHPLIIVVIISAVAVGVYLLRRRGTKSQTALRHELKQQYGDSLQVYDLKELEFLELAQLALSDSDFGKPEEEYLLRWSRKHGWNQSKYETLMAEAKQRRDSTDSHCSTDEHLLNLIRLALADGRLSEFEIRSIRKTARKLGYDDSTIRELMQRVRQSALNAA